MHMHKTQTPVLADKNAEQVVGFERTETVVAHPSMVGKWLIIRVLDASILLSTLA